MIKLQTIKKNQSSNIDNIGIQKITPESINVGDIKISKEKQNKKEKKIDGLTHTHDSSLDVKVKDMKPTEHNTEPSSVCKLNKGEIEGNPLPGIHTEHVNEEVQNSLTKIHLKSLLANDNTTLHELENVACTLNKTQVLNINNTSDLINDRDAGHAENMIRLYIYIYDL